MSGQNQRLTAFHRGAFFVLAGEPGEFRENRRLTCSVEENGDFQILDLRTPYCTLDNIGGVPASDAPGADPAS